jgi:GNAT superfamily N-acetyltransferase
METQVIDNSSETETRLLTIKGFEDFITMLEAVNGEVLALEVKERLKQDFVKGRFKGFKLFQKESIVGIAVFIDTYSAVHARKILLLDELYIREAFRGRGLGKALFDTVVEYAKSNNYMRLEWRTEKDNIAAQALYSQYKTNSNSIYYLMEL